MSEAIDYLENRSDVAKTTYSYYDDTDDAQVTVEMWHTTDQLHHLFNKAMELDTSKRGLQRYAKEQAIATRTVRESLSALYPDVVQQFEDRDESE